MELNLMSTDLTYPNVNVVFDDSLFQLLDDTAFVLTVNERFNSFVTFPSHAKSIRIGGNPYNYNQPLTLPGTVESLYSCFYNCYRFNQPVTIPDSATNCEAMFERCYNLNQPVIIGNNVKNCRAMFEWTSNFNQPITIPDSVVNCEYMFRWSNNFNQPITIPNSVTNCIAMFQYTPYNQPVTLSDGLLNCQELFVSADYFNQPVTIPDSVRTCYNMFSSCLRYNQSVQIGKDVQTCHGMFQSCRSYSQPVYIPNRVTNCANMFVSVTAYNSTVIISPSVINTSGMFLNVNSQPYNIYNDRFAPFDNNALKMPIYFYANSIINAQYMFNSCNSISDLYITGIKSNLQMNRFIRNNGQVRCNIYTDDISQNHLYNTYLLSNGGKPTWTVDATNGCIYDTVTNLYIYNNWDGRIEDFYYLNYYRNDGSQRLYQQLLPNGGNGTFTYGSNEWSDTPNGQPITGITDNITADTDVYYAGEFIAYWIRQYLNVTSNSAYSEVNGYFNTTNNGGIVISGNTIAGVSYKAEPGYSYIQTGICQTYATLPTIYTSGTGRISYSANNNGDLFATASQDIYLAGNNMNMSYAITFREGAVVNNGVRIITGSTGGYDASLYIKVGDEDTDVLHYQSASSGVEYGNLLNIRYSGSWSAVALTNLTDGVNNYSTGDVVRVWSYSQSKAFTVWEV